MKNMIMVLLAAWLPVALGSVDTAQAISSTTDVSSLELTDTQGTVFKTSQSYTAGKKVLLVFWQTLCASCRREAPHISELAAKYAETLDVFGVVSGPESMVKTDAVIQTAEKWGITYPTVLDRSLELTKHFKVRGTPTLILLGEGDQILAQAHLLDEGFLKILNEK